MRACSLISFLLRFLFAIVLLDRFADSTHVDNEIREGADDSEHFSAVDHLLGARLHRRMVSKEADRHKCPYRTPKTKRAGRHIARSFVS